MKNCLLIFCVLLLNATVASAQKDADAGKILRAVSEKYKSYNTIKTDFVFTADNPQGHTKYTQTGTLITQSKNNKFKVTLYGNPVKGKLPVEQEIISDGKTQWTYLKKDNEVQVNDADKGNDGVNPAQIFTMYEKGYKYVYTGDQTINGKLCQVIELSPLDVKKSIFKVRLFIDKARKEIYSATLFDRSGARYTYTLKTINANPAVTANSFMFDAKTHPGVEVVDLR